jgi:cytoskeletal protein CcmA (bactofilin family)
LSEAEDRTTQHLDEMTCLLYMERQMERARAQEVSAHAQDCEACRTLLRALEREARLLTRALIEENEPLPERLARLEERARRSMQWVWGVVLGLAATGAYALYTGFIEPWQTQLEQAGFGGSNLLGLLIFQGAFWKGWQSMVTLIEVLAVLILAGFAVAFFRRRIRRGSALALVLAGLCAALTAAPASFATEMRSGNSTEIKRDENIKGDVYLTGQRIRVEGTVDGDVFAAGKDIDIDGHVLGDVISAGTIVRIRGKVDGNVRSAGNTISITGSVGKNVMWFGETVDLDSSGKIGGGLTMFGTTGNIDGRLERDILFFGDTLHLSGGVGGNVRAQGASLIINSTAQVDGTIKFEGRNEPNVATEAKLAHQVEYTKMVRKHEYERGAGYYIWRVIWTAAFALFGLVVFLLLPKFAEETVRAGEQIGASAGLGVLVLFGVPIAAVIACFTVVGLILGITGIILWIFMLVSAQLVVGAVMGQWLMGKARETWPLIGRMVVGLVIVRLITTIPHLTFWTRLAVVLWGMGALSLAIYRRFQPVIAPSVPSAPVATSAPMGGAQLA